MPLQLKGSLFSLNSGSSTNQVFFQWGTLDHFSFSSLILSLVKWAILTECMSLLSSYAYAILSTWLVCFSEKTLVNLILSHSLFLTPSRIPIWYSPQRTQSLEFWIDIMKQSLKILLPKIHLFFVKFLKVDF